MKIEPIQSKRGRWRFKIRDSDNKIVVPIPVKGYDTEVEALEAANRLLDHRSEAYKEKIAADADWIKRLQGELDSASGIAQENVGTANDATRRLKFWRALTAASWLAAVGLAILYLSAT